MRNFKNMDEAQYKEYMKHYNAAVNAFASIAEYAGKIDNEKLKCRQECAKLDADNTISESYRAKRTQEVRDNALKSLESYWAGVEPLFSTFADELDAITEHIDLNDTRLTAAVTLINAAGVYRGDAGAMPSGSVQRALIEPFNGNPEALTMLRGLADSNGLAGAVTEIDNKLETINKALSFPGFVAQHMREATLSVDGEFVQINTSPYVDAVCKAYGFTRPELPEELVIAATRKAMGLSANPHDFTSNWHTHTAECGVYIDMNTGEAKTV